jgi:hypothetical protein
LKRHGDLPDVPLMQELVADPGLPTDRLAALRSAFDRMVRDPEYLAQANKMGIGVDPTSGGETQRISDAIVETPASIVQMAIQASQ